MQLKSQKPGKEPRLPESQQEGKSMAPPQFSLDASPADKSPGSQGGTINGDQEKKAPLTMGGSLQEILGGAQVSAQAGADKGLDKGPHMGMFAGMMGGALTSSLAQGPQITHSTLSKAPDGSPNDRRKIGVGEQVVFNYPADGEWTATSGTPKSQAPGKSFIWTAPTRAGYSFITVRSGKDIKMVVLEVVEPQEVEMKKYGEMSIPAGQMGAGMYLTLDYHPMSVSFDNVEAGEVDGPASNVSGYFTGATMETLWHDALDAFTPMGPSNRLSSHDTAWEIGWPKPWSEGEYHIIIPNRFRVKGEGGEGKVFDYVDQAAYIKADGTFTINKDGQSVTRKPDGSVPTP